jgi:hypothetical protein
LRVRHVLHAPARPPLVPSSPFLPVVWRVAGPLVECIRQSGFSILQFETVGVLLLLFQLQYIDAGLTTAATRREVGGDTQRKAGVRARRYATRCMPSAFRFGAACRSLQARHRAVAAVRPWPVDPNRALRKAAHSLCVRAPLFGAVRPCDACPAADWSNICRSRFSPRRSPRAALTAVDVELQCRSPSLPRSLRAPRASKSSSVFPNFRCPRAAGCRRVLPRFATGCRRVPDGFLRVAMGCYELETGCRSVLKHLPLMRAQVPREHGGAHAHAGPDPDVHSRTRGPDLLACSGNQAWPGHIKCELKACAYLSARLVLAEIPLIAQWLVENHPTKPAKAEWHEVRANRFRRIIHATLLLRHALYSLAWDPNRRRWYSS